MPATQESDKTFIEFFAGVGLVHMALKQLGWTAVFANDNCPKKKAGYQANFGDTTFSCADIRTLNASELPSARLATASFPCIDVSQAGGRSGLEGKDSSLFWTFIRLIEELNSQGRSPEYLLIENVPGLLAHHGGRDIDRVLQAVTDCGYAVDLIQVDARAFLPQARNRVFVVGVKDARPSAKLAQLPDIWIRRYHVQKTYNRCGSLPWHLFDFPPLPSRTVTLDSVLERIPPDSSRWWNSDRMSYFWKRLEKGHDEHLRNLMANGPCEFLLTAVRRGRRRGLREQIINLRTDGLASCLRTPKGGSSIQFIVHRKDDWLGVRRITGLESARLQGVCRGEDTYMLVGSETEQLHAFGDAVCVPVVRWVVEHSIEAYMAGIRTKWPTRAQLSLAI